MKKYAPFLALCLAVLALFVWIRFRPSAHRQAGSGEQIEVFVSILPQKHFVEKVGGGRVRVLALVGPGQSPATYEPLPQQMADLAQAALYFRIGVPFEAAWLDKIAGLNPQLRIVDTRRGITLRSMGGGEDPHIWLDPLLVKTQAATIYEELAASDPENSAYYAENLDAFWRELDELDAELAAVLGTLGTEKLMVFHPAWGYLLERYRITQLPIEFEGKEPGPRLLAEVIDTAQKEGIKVIFAEEQYDGQTALAVARAVGGKVVKLDPLAEDYIANLRSIAEAIKKEH
ncbi:MAG TPA: zinc ABC transporter solute-binding protein [Firmicutes bacterium]|nr:zinc ABC transporter solute-binding protein [Bacillota bacterium]